jgi:hypothetical protein
MSPHHGILSTRLLRINQETLASFTVFATVGGHGVNDPRRSPRLPSGTSPRRCTGCGVEGERVWMTFECGACIVRSFAWFGECHARTVIG